MTQRNARGLRVLTVTATCGIAVLLLSARVPVAPEPDAGLQVLTPHLPAAFDPLEDGTASARDVFANVFETLVAADAEGRLVPGLAVSWSSPGPQTWRFRLREGVLFHDGTSLTGEDVARALREARGSPLYAAHLALVTSVAADGADVVLRTEAPAPALAHSLTAVPIAKRAGGARVGTGPYRLVHAVPGLLCRLERVSPPHARGAPFSRVVFRRFASAAEAVALMTQDARTVVLRPPRELVDALPGGRARAVSLRGGSLSYLAFDLARDPTPGVALRRNPFLDRRVRHAVRLALDPLELSAAAAREASPASQLVPPGVLGFNPALGIPGRNLHAARRLLAEAGLPHGFASALDASHVQQPLAESVSRQLAAVGIEARVDAAPVEEFRRRLAAGSSLYVANWVVGSASGEALAAFLHTREPARRLGLLNQTGYASRDVDVLVEKALATEDAVEGTRLLQRAMAVLMDDLPWVPLYSARPLRIYPRGVSFPERSDVLLVLREGRLAGPPSGPGT